MTGRPFRSRSTDRKYRKYEYGSSHARQRSIERTYTPRERLSDYRDRSRDRRYRGHTPSYSRERSYDRRRDRRSYDRYSGRDYGRELRRSDSHREERYRDSSDRRKHHTYNKYDRSPSRSIRRKHYRSRSVSLGYRDERRTPSEPLEKMSVPEPPRVPPSGSTPSGTSKGGSNLSQGPEPAPQKPTLNTNRTLTVMRDGKLITSTIAPIVNKAPGSVAATGSVNPFISGVKLDPEAIAKSRMRAAAIKLNIEGASNKDAQKQGSSAQDKGQKEDPEDTWKGFPTPKHYKKLTKYYDAVAKFGALTPSMYFPLDGAKLRRYKAYKCYNDKLRRFNDFKFQRRQLEKLVKFDFDYFRLKLEVSLNTNSKFQLLKVNMTASKLCYII
ncbi:hypothetical protein MACJ_002454 [Theileria orientalis]|uniref:Uncharacterized protein n=1 Tax=Theileria orientalis TaxID=68886 RepID=A0A976M682_THEOR|nr:hypothetical protein MACJ_002454 [Theileria orientalis]